MLIHTTPRFYTCRHSGPVELVDLRIEELGVHLQGGKELTTRQPYPNKRYVVACKKVGRKAMEGLLFETDGKIQRYTVTTRWALRAEFIATHRVHYVVLDEDFDAVTDNMVLWHRMSEGLGGWPSRWPDAHANAVPCDAQPRMQFSREPERTGSIVDRVTGPLSIERVETFPVPTVERERLLTPRSVTERIPTIEMAFRTSTVAVTENAERTRAGD
ncbi:hypothetical protein E2P84_42375 [Burkholderia cepacia]|uniref:Uncharacterized protein n=1 Tax=Burkholderia cepacia TaxID=292 RepID=A0AAX2RS29_BURCE|nr:DUF6012 family protein [Burkholderia cepacia]TES62205.1 hypothetical protein E2P84_42375 [Burkholderia cepacia]TET01703.1 hypothetical protein E3D36_16845 [Burkholderia cepacia]TEU47561.1 hypothetical protein E3D37_16275 [Burkholderia cepacia]TEU53433.1 hypothetical protein E3D38_11860 [Burkholderia cepacia]TEV02194.1 hypothetical protein E3D40_13595 [Burkholderia cepacia]